MHRIKVHNQNSPAEWDALYHSENAERWSIWQGAGLIQAFVDRLPQRASILDCGVGPGWTMRILRERRPDLTQWSGADFSQGSLDYVQPFQWEGLHHVDLNTYPWPFPDKSYDVTICSEVLEHLEAPWMAATELQRIARKMVAVTTPNENHIDSKYHVWSFNGDDLRRMFPNAEVLRVRAEDAILVCFSRLK